MLHCNRANARQRRVRKGQEQKETDTGKASAMLDPNKEVVISYSVIGVLVFLIGITAKYLSGSLMVYYTVKTVLIASGVWLIYLALKAYRQRH